MQSWAHPHGTSQFKPTHGKKLRDVKQNRFVQPHSIRVPQESVQIVLIFRLLLKITVDWLYNAIYKCL